MMVCQTALWASLAPPPMPVGSLSMVSMPPVPASTSCFWSQSSRSLKGWLPRASARVFTSDPPGRAPQAASAAEAAARAYSASRPAGTLGGMMMNTPGMP